MQFPCILGYLPFSWTGDVKVCADFGVYYHDSSTTSPLLNIEYPNAPAGAAVQSVQPAAAEVHPMVAAQAAAPGMTLAAAQVLFGNPQAAEAARDPSSPAAQAELQQFMQKLQAGIEGYNWQVRLSGVACKQVKGAFNVLVGLRGMRSYRQNGKLALDRIMEDEKFCDHWYAFSCWMQDMPMNETDVELDLTKCLKRNALEPNRAPKVPGSPGEGPTSVPLRVRDLVFYVTDAQDKDITSTFQFRDKVAITWTYVVDHQQQQQQQNVVKGESLQGLGLPETSMGASSSVSFGQVSGVAETRLSARAARAARQGAGP